MRDQTNLQVLPGINHIGPNNIVIVEFKGNDSAFYGARIWMTR